MKIENPLLRKVELIFHNLDEVVDVWMTDSDIEYSKHFNWNLFGSQRIQSSPWSTIEFSSKYYKLMKPTNEIRHKLSPIISTMTLRRKMINCLPIPDVEYIHSKYVSRSIGYFFVQDNSIEIIDFSKVPDSDLLFLSSIELIEEICQWHKINSKALTNNNLIFIEHFFEER